MKQFLPFITDDIGRSLKVEDAVVVTSSIPDPLNNSPEGWENNTLQWARNNEFRGVIKSYTTPLKFYLDGAKILRNAFYRMGMETVLFFIWLKQNTAFGAGMKYEGWYKGEPDFGTFKDEYEGVEITVTETGFYKDLQANKTVVYNVPFDGDAKYLYMDGLALDETLHFEIQEGFSLGPDYSYLYMPLTFLNNDGASAGITYYSQIGEEVVSPDYSSPRFFLGTQLTLNAHFKGAINFTITGSGFLTAKWYLHTQTRQFLIFDDHDYTPGDYSLPFEFDFAIDPNENVYFMSDAPSTGIDIFITFHQGPFDVSYSSRAPSNIVPIYRAYDYGNKLVKLMSPGHSLTSPLLEPDQNLMITCGDAIRNIPNAVVKGNFSDYNKSIDAVKCIAIDISGDNPVLSSRYDKFNKNSSIASLGECSNWTLEPAPDYIYDKVESGYPAKSSQSNSDVNGKYSFNNTFLWKLNTTRRNINQYECKSAYFADPYDIELIRVNFANKDTTTANTDNSIFFIDCEPKTDVNYTGTTAFITFENKIRLSSSLTGILPFLTPGIKIQVTGSAFNDGIYTITVVNNSVLFSNVELTVAELITTDETTTANVDLYNLYQLRRKTYATITGIPNDGTIFNIELSPRRCLQNHLRWLRSSFDHLDMNKLVFTSTDKNADLVTTDNDGNVISEKADILVSSMGEKVYLPYITKMLVKSPYNLKEIMDNYNGERFDYLRSGLPFNGFPIDIKTEDYTLESQTYELLCTADNDLTLLINNR